MLPKSARDCCAKVFVRQQMFHPLGKYQTVTNKKLGMTYKKLTSIPSKYMTPENLAKVDDYLNITSRLKRETLHFFDEASVIVTSGNRMFGRGYREQPAIEVQRYGSNANYTILELTN